MRPITTLFMLSSIDGKISTGSNNSLDFDKDLKLIEGIREGLHQYYEIEGTTDLWSLTTGKIQNKLGREYFEIKGLDFMSFVVLDNIHLTKDGIINLCKSLKQVVLVTSNRKHPARKLKLDNLEVLCNVTIEDVFAHLYEKYNCERLTVQSGGTVNGMLLKHKLIDYIDIVIAPVIVGGRDTPSLFDGRSIVHPNELKELGILKLTSCEELENSYIRLKYKVLG